MSSPASSDGGSPVESSSPKPEESEAPALSSSPTRTSALKRMREQSLEPTSVEQEGERSDTRAPAKRIRRSGSGVEVSGDKTPTRDGSPTSHSPHRSPRLLSKPPSPIPEDDKSSESGGESQSSPHNSQHGDEREMSPEVPATAEGPNVKAVRQGVKELSMPEESSAARKIVKKKGTRSPTSAIHEEEKEDDYVFVDHDAVAKDAEADNVEMSDDIHAAQSAPSAQHSVTPAEPHNASSTAAIPTDKHSTDVDMHDGHGHPEQDGVVPGGDTNVEMKEDDKLNEPSTLTVDEPSTHQNGNASPVEPSAPSFRRASVGSFRNSPPRPSGPELADNDSGVPPLERKRKTSAGRDEDEDQRQKSPPKRSRESSPVASVKSTVDPSAAKPSISPTAIDTAKTKEAPTPAVDEPAAAAANPIANGFAAFRMGKLNFTPPAYLTPGTSTSTPSTSSTSWTSPTEPSTSNSFGGSSFGGAKSSSSGLFGGIKARSFGEPSSETFSSSSTTSVFGGSTNVFGSGGSFLKSDVPALGGPVSVFGNQPQASQGSGSTSAAGRRGPEDRQRSNKSGSEQSKAERPVVEGEEGEVTIDSAYAVLYEDGKTHGNGPIKLNIRPEENDRGRLIMRAAGNMRVVLNLWLYQDMPPIFVGEKFIRVLCPEDKRLVVKDIKFMTGEIRARFFENIEQWRPKQPRMLEVASSGPSAGNATALTTFAPSNDVSDDLDVESQPLADDDDDATEISLEDTDDEADVARRAATARSSEEALAGSDVAPADYEPVAQQNEKDEEQDSEQVEAQLSEEDGDDDTETKDGKTTVAAPIDFAKDDAVSATNTDQEGVSSQRRLADSSPITGAEAGRNTES